jgi:diaminopimelate decarboxylase
LEAAFPDPWIRQFSIKANDVPAIIAELARLGLGANVVSRGEWARTRRAGLPNESITLEGVGKTDADLRAAVSAARRGHPLRWVAVESPEEAEALATFARRAHVTIDVLFRLNPDVAPDTPAGLDVGSGASKFGMTETELTRAVQRLDGAASGGLGGLRPRGIHLHVGSQLGAIDAWRDGLRRAVAVLGLVRGSLPDFDTLDVGGGFPVAPFGSGSRVPAPGRFAREVPALLEAVPADRRPLRLAAEPGRFLVARAGWIVARVLHVRDRGARLAVIDAGMAELIRPALYGAVHPVVALTSRGEPVDDAGPAVSLRPGYEPTRVDGPICESTDTLGVHSLPPLRRGDLVAIRDAGAYAASMSSAYNGRPRRAQVLLR